MQQINFSKIVANPNSRRRSYEQFFLTKGQLAQSLMNCSAVVRQRVGVFESRVATGKNYWFDPDVVNERMDALDREVKKAEFMTRMEKARRRKEKEKLVELDTNDWLAGRLKQ